MTTEDWSWFSEAMVKIRHQGRDAWVTTLPMTCPRCRLDWSYDGMQRIGGHTYWGWGQPPDGGVVTGYYRCEGCGHTAYARRDE